jgi:amino acid transporter
VLNANLAGKKKGFKFGTFSGVFTPSILTIFGVIMFMRANYVVGEAGIIHAVLILGLAQIITLITTLSVGAIATNMPVKGGGAYFLVSRVLGAEFGGAIGLALFAAQVVSISFYLLGFAEAMTKAIPYCESHFLLVALGAALILFFIARVGADWAIKTQYLIMAVLFSSIFVYLAGAAEKFSLSQFRMNLSPAPGASGATGFWMLFAIYFPSVTGFIAGINMSGDLENPGESMTKGTLYALLMATTVYFLQIIVYGGGFPREVLIATPFKVMVKNAWLGAEFMVVAGVFAATLSSALGRYVGAPRVLQAIARDELVPFLKPFAKGYGPGDEPRRGLYLCAIVTLVLLWLGGDGSGGAFLNSVATIMGMFFLFTFGLLNLAAFVEAFSGNPSFRPRFRYFHWSLALAGVIGSFGSALLVDFTAAVIALGVIALLGWYLRKREMVISFGDARRGYLYNRIKNSLFDLQSLPDDARNWRPSIMTLSKNPKSRETLVSYAVWLNAGRGIVVLANILPGNIRELAESRTMACQQLDVFLKEKGIQAFSQVVVADDVLTGVRTILRGSAYGPLRPNIFICGWKGESYSQPLYVEFLREASVLNVSQTLVYDRGLPDPDSDKHIDIWWRGHKNGPLMILLAHLLIHNWEWSGSEITLKRVVQEESEKTEAFEELRNLLEEARVDAQVEVVITTAPFSETLHKHSASASCVFLGFELPEPGLEASWLANYDKLLKQMPTTLLVHSVDGKDYLRG